MAIQRYRRKPERVRPRDTGLTTARYEPGEPLDDLRAVAALVNASFPQEMTEAELPSGRVLVVRWYSWRHDESELEWTIVQPRQLLTYSRKYRSLEAEDDTDLQALYDLVVE